MIKRVKAVTSIIALITFVTIVIYPPMTLKHVDCIEDKVQIALQPHYDYFALNKVMKNYLLIAFAGLTDVLLLIFLARWSYKGGSWRFIMTLTLTYILRYIFVSLFKIRFPEGGDLWEFPGFYSLTVQYGNSNDYYFNPVVAICV